MKKKEKPTNATVKTDRHKPTRMVRLPAALAAELKKLADENFSNVTQETIRLVREGLRREGRLPPSDAGD